MVEHKDLLNQLKQILDLEKKHHLKLEEAIAKSLIAFEEIMFYKQDKRRLLKRIGALEDAVTRLNSICSIRGFLASFFVGIVIGLFIAWFFYSIIL